MLLDKERAMAYIGFIILISSTGCLAACDYSVTVKQSLWMEGFHRNMTYEVSFVPFSSGPEPEVWPYDDCLLGIHQILPSGIYANPDELSELRRSHRLNAISKRTNIELPAEHSEPVTVYVIKKITGHTEYTWLPLHARYHKALRYGGYALNEIEPPQVYIRCPDKRLETCKNPLQPARYLCAGKDKCTWKEISMTMSTHTPIVWRVPIGDLHHYYPVAIVTTLAVTIGSLYLLQTINEFKYINSHTYNTR